MDLVCESRFARLLLTAALAGVLAGLFTLGLARNAHAYAGPVQSMAARSSVSANCRSLDPVHAFGVLYHGQTVLILSNPASNPALGLTIVYNGTLANDRGVKVFGGLNPGERQVVKQPAGHGVNYAFVYVSSPDGSTNCQVRFVFFGFMRS